MLSLIFTLILIGSTYGKSITPLTNEVLIIDYINTLNTTWKAGKNFDNFSYDYVKKLAGTAIESGQLIKPKNYQINKNHNHTYIDLPEHFDARDVWPNCDSISTIRDQGACGSCWAVSTVSVMSDRLCIKSNGTINVQLSAEEVIGCCDYCGKGCKNGYALMAFDYWIEHGIVTGGQYQGGGCLPYSIAPCKRSVNDTQFSCEKVLSESPSCSQKCISSYGKKFESDKFFGQKSYSFYKPYEIMFEIMTNGPVAGRMAIFSDFYNYKSGVYQYETGEWLGHHTVKIIGWGNDKGVDYWLVANTWNTNWGDEGFFKIKRGEDECGIESYVLAGEPKL